VTTNTTDYSQTALIELLGDVLKLEGRTASLGPDTALLGALPELDSMAVILVIVEIENRFDIYFHDDEVSSEMFETVATLQAAVAGKLTVPQ